MDDDPVVLALLTALKSRDSVEVRLALGGHFRKMGMHAEALAHFEKALLLSPSNAEALRGAAEAAGALGQADKAEAYRIACSALGPQEDLKAPEEKSPSPLDTSQVPGPLSDLPESRLAGTSSIRIVAREGQLLEEPMSAVTFEDVAGMDDVKTMLARSFITPVRNPELQKKFGKKVSGGLILYGPPGCGKTFLARAVAGEIGARFINISLLDVLDMWFGESEKKIHELFENARRTAPSLLFFDEIDALGQKRTHLKGTAGRTLVNQLLSEMDGFDGTKEGVFFLAATNHPWDVDTALRRPGRFDRLVFVPPPDWPAREKILQLKIEGRPASGAIDFASIARATEGFSGADLEGLVERATELAIEESMKAGVEKPIEQSHFERMLKDTRPSTRPWLEVARNYAVYANEGGTYDDLYAYLKKQRLA